MSAGQPRSARSRDQLALLMGLWWRHMLRRPRRLGDLPKQSGVPTFLLINLLSLGYLMPTAFIFIRADTMADVGNFAWHALGIVVAALGAGLASRSLSLQRRPRDDLFLEALPLSLRARLGLALLDGHLAIVLALLVPLAGVIGLRDRGGHTLSVVLFGWLLYLCVFLAGSALRAWLRVLGTALMARMTNYAGTGLSVAGFGLIYFSIPELTRPGPVARVVAEAWLVGGASLGVLYGAAALLGLCAYGALARAERRGFDRLDPAAEPPRQHKGLRSRQALEGLLIWRQGGRPLLITFSALLLGALGSAWMAEERRVPEQGGYLLFVGMVVYFGSIQTIGLAGRSARSDLVARPFLSALPLAPHQVLEGKASVLRWMLIPVFLALAFVAMAALRDFPELGLRAVLAAVALYVVVAGAVAVAFLSSGVGVAGVGGGQVGSSFSTQLLLMPMLATVFAHDTAAACVSLIAVLAVTREALRAARVSVRWIDDSDPDTERETSVWRALLAATVFFSTQMFASGVLAPFQLPRAYALAISFSFASGALVLLTVRSRERFDKPHILPRRPWHPALGLLAGAASGRLAVWAAQLRAGSVLEPSRTTTMGETAAWLLSMIVVAPIAEEYFFRGWLQKAIEQDLPAQHKRWAFALGALAFALAHVGGYGVPQLVVGLIAGALYANGGGLSSAIFAHAAHNAAVMYFGL